jgi:hypothetical protein
MVADREREKALIGIGLEGAQADMGRTSCSVALPIPAH